MKSAAHTRLSTLPPAAGLLYRTIHVWHELHTANQGDCDCDKRYEPGISLISLSSISPALELSNTTHSNIIDEMVRFINNTSTTSMPSIRMCILRFAAARFLLLLVFSSPRKAKTCSLRRTMPDVSAALNLWMGGSERKILSCHSATHGHLFSANKSPTYVGWRGAWTAC